MEAFLRIGAQIVAFAARRRLALAADRQQVLVDRHVEVGRGHAGGERDDLDGAVGGADVECGKGAGPYRANAGRTIAEQVGHLPLHAGEFVEQVAAEMDTAHVGPPEQGTRET